MPKVADWEPFAGLVSSVVALITWAPWYGDIFRVNRLAAPRSYRLVLGIAPIACLLFLLLCLERSAAKAVRESGFYILIMDLVRSNEDLGSDYIANDFMYPLTEEIRNARPLAAVLPQDVMTHVTLVAATVLAGIEDDRAAS